MLGQPTLQASGSKISLTVEVAAAKRCEHRFQDKVATLSLQAFTPRYLGWGGSSERCRGVSGSAEAEKSTGWIRRSLPAEGCKADVGHLELTPDRMMVMVVEEAGEEEED